MSRSIPSIVLIAIFVASSGCNSVERGCFEASAPIDTPSGTRAISELRAGDVVLSWNVEKAVREVSVVQAILREQGEEWRTLRGRTFSFRSTKEHPVFVVEKASYLSAETVQPGMTLLLSSPTGTTIEQVVDTKDEDTDPIDVFNLSVAHRNYFAFGVLVHNKTPLGCEPAKIVSSTIQSGKIYPAGTTELQLEARMDAPVAFIANPEATNGILVLTAFMNSRFESTIEVPAILTNSSTINASLQGLLDGRQYDLGFHHLRPLDCPREILGIRFYLAPQ